MPVRTFMRNTLQRLGIKPIYGDYFPPNASEVSEIEQMLAAKLPVDFLDFLNNFGISSISGLASVTAPSGRVLPIDRFYGGHSPRGHYNILRLPS